MKWVTRLLLFILVIAAALFVVSLFIPGTIKSSSTATIDAPSPIVFSQLNELKKWEEWDAWHKLDPDAKMDYSIPSSGKGAWYSWDGSKLGTGKVTITDANPGKSLGYELDLGHGSKANSNFIIDTEGDRTKLTWNFESKIGMNPIAKFMTMGMGKEVKKMSDEGLKNLSDLCFKEYQEFKKIQQEMKALEDTLKPAIIQPAQAEPAVVPAPAVK